MDIRRISAHYVFPGHTSPLKYGIVEFDSEGRVTDLIDTGGKFKEKAFLEFYTGIITPAFIISPFLKDLSDLNPEFPELVPVIEDLFSFTERISTRYLAEEQAEFREILKYLMMLRERYPTMSLKEQISLITYQAACALNIQHEYGCLEPGKKPGINLITGVDLGELRITGETEVVRVV